MKIRPRAWKSPLGSATALFFGFVLAVGHSASAAEPVAGVVLEKGITYGKGGNEDLKLDLAQPEHAEGLLPGIVYIHGGGWSGGAGRAYRNEFKRRPNVDTLPSQSSIDSPSPIKVARRNLPSPHRSRTASVPFAGCGPTPRNTTSTPTASVRPADRPAAT